MVTWNGANIVGSFLAKHNQGNSMRNKDSWWLERTSNYQPWTITNRSKRETTIT
jgi:hypothetical protein